LVALTDRVENTKLADPAKIGAAAERILARSPVRSCFVTTIGPGTFTWRHDKTALDYEQRLLAGRYVLTTSLTTTQASTGEIVAHYQSLANVEHRFRVMKDFLGLRPVYHWTEDRVRGHIAICVLAAVIACSSTATEESPLLNQALWVPETGSCCVWRLVGTRHVDEAVAAGFGGHRDAGPEHGDRRRVWWLLAE
jgi:hypothetical protein